MYFSVSEKNLSISLHMRHFFLIPACLYCLASCAPRYQAHFGKSSPVAYERPSLPVRTEAPPVAADTARSIPSETPAGTLPATVTPELLASTAEKLVARTKGTAYERKALKIQRQLREVSNRTLVAKTPSTRAEQQYARKLTRKIQDQVAKAKKLQKTQATNSGIRTGIILLLIGLLLTLLIANPTVVVIGLILIIVGAVALIIGLFDTL